MSFGIVNAKIEMFGKLSDMSGSTMLELPLKIKK
jgi:hypothetical protein